MMSLFSLTLTLFLVMDPLGKVKHFLRLLGDIPAKRQKVVIAREMGIALIAMLVFSLLGEKISGAFQVDRTTVFLSSGVILFLSAINILFPRGDHFPQIHNEEPFIVPIAIPIIASPALLAMIMLFSQAEPNTWLMLVAVVAAWAISSLLLLSSRTLVRVLTQNGLLAIERLMGMILVLIAIQRFLEGIMLFMAEK